MEHLLKPYTSILMAGWATAAKHNISTPASVMLVSPKLRNESWREIFPVHTHSKISRVGTVRSKSAKAGQLASVMPSLWGRLMWMRESEGSEKGGVL